MDSRKPDLSEAFLAALRALMRLLHETQQEGVIIGGIAVGLQGYPRATRDVDILLDAGELDLAQFIDYALQLGFEPRVPNLLDFARRNYVIKLIHRDGQIPVDISLAYTPLELQIIREGNKITVHGITVPVARPEDLLIMKCIAQRSIDLVDVHELYQLYGDQIDLQRVRYWVEQFAEALEEPDLWAKVEPLLQRDSGTG
jgi:predicted nucleotidyltransferase